MANHPLLEPRFVPIYDNGVHYPGSVFTEDQIIKTKDGYVDTYGMYKIKVDFLRTHKRLFRELHWAEKRYEWEMPEYIMLVVKPHMKPVAYGMGISSGNIYKVLRFVDFPFDRMDVAMIQLEIIGSIYVTSNVFLPLPSTKEDYEKQTKGDLADTNK